MDVGVAVGVRVGVAVMVGVIEGPKGGVIVLKGTGTLGPGGVVGARSLCAAPGIVVTWL